jgi:hypothetical protein
MVYVEARTKDISTVLCRCMPPQVKKLSGESVYELMLLAQVRTLLESLTANGRGREALTATTLNGIPAQGFRLPQDW